MKPTGYVSFAATILAAVPAFACDKVDYVEAKTWSTAKIKRQYCADVGENFDRLKLKLDGVADYDRHAAQRCDDQVRLYERLLDERGISEYDLKGICAKS